MEGDTTETLRTLAPKWTLAGDDKLVGILQSTHQRIITKCQEVNTKLGDMSSALDEASISLQNVNNKFMALSNSQFIESRVYDDDEVTEDKTAQQLPPKTVESEISLLKRSIAVIESMHESVTILRDSDTESDSEDEGISTTVLKPKDMYTDRPLPHIIGSQAWKNKWHAGLMPEDSDTESETSKRETRESDQYSESDQEIEMNTQIDKLTVPDRTVSETSSDLASEQEIPAPKQTPSDIAAELARRLGGHPPKVIEPEPEVIQPKPPVRKVYKTEQPVTGRVFLDEPPPIDDYMSESSSDNGDIFAELHKQKPQEVKRNADVVEDLFGFHKDDNYQGGDIFRDFAADKVVSNQSTNKSSLFDDEPESELFVNKNEDKHQIVEKIEEDKSSTSDIKKPVGGVSLFGNNKGAESIGAAILRRHRKSSSSSEEMNIEPVSKNDMFEDLFVKSKRKNSDKVPKVNENANKAVIDEIFEKNKQKNTVKIGVNKSNVINDLIEKSKNTCKKPTLEITLKEDTKTKEQSKIDLFNDDLFDDIDDIFTTNVKIPKKDDKQKSLFDDVDDLFAEVAPKSKVIVKNEDIKENKNVFESDDDLFSDKPKVTKSKVAGENNVKDTKEIGSIASKSKKVDRSIFDSDDELFNDKPNANKELVNPSRKLMDNVTKVTTNETKSANKSIFDSDEELISKKTLLSGRKDIENYKSIETTEESGSVNKENDIINPKPNIMIDVNELKPKNETTVKQAKSDSNSVKNKDIDKNKSIFDSDSDSDIFLKVGAKTTIRSASKVLNEPKHTPEIRSSNQISNLNLNNNLRSESLFDDDDEELFTTKNKIKVTDMQSSTSVRGAEGDLSKNVETLKEDGYKKTIDVDGTSHSEISSSHSNVQPGNTKSITSKLYNDKDELFNAPSDIQDNNLHESSDNNVNKCNVSFTNDIESHSKYTENTQIKALDNTEKRPYKDNTDLLDNALLERNTKQFTSVHEHEFKDIFTSNKIVKDQISEQENLDVEKTKLFEQNINTAPNNKPHDTFDDIFKSKSKVTEIEEVAPKPDSFSDIFAEPPVFEKPKEPKKSKNVNALFDDDSDDEALFFKKSDVIDEIPPDFSPEVKKDNLFGIFHDEPPAIEVDFTTKTITNDNHEESLVPNNDYQFLEEVEDVLSNETESVTHNSKIKNETPQKLDKKELNENNTPNEDRKSINIHDLFSKDEDIFKISKKSEGDQKNMEPVEEKENDKLSADHEYECKNSSIEKKGDLKINEIIDGQSDEGLFKSACFVEKKKVIVQEDEIDNLFLNKNKNLKYDDKAFDNIFNRTGKEILIKETKVISDTEENINKNSDVSPKSVVIKESKITSHSNDDLIKTSETSPSKIGKLKAKMNIDVSKLLPGASPIRRVNKPKSPDQETSPNSIVAPSTNRENVLASKDSSDNTEQKSKSISFNNQESTILDNTLSKERAKIQVKRRPSTRRARREAVRKSVIDNDSTDNSIDDQPKSLDMEQPMSLEIDQPLSLEIEEDKDFGDKSNDNQKNILDDKNLLENRDMINEVNLEKEKPVDSNYFKAIDDIDLINKDIDISKEQIPNVESNTEKSRDVKSKIVYVLNDEDIFNTKAESNGNKLAKTENINPISTLGNVYKDSVVKKPKAPLFDDSDEERLFGKSKNRKVFSTKPLFDSDSDDDLFVGAKEKEKKDVKRAPIVKGSLFGDDDDDDLFGVKNKKSDTLRTSQPRTSRGNNSAKPVFQDPLSMFGSDD